MEAKTKQDLIISPDGFSESFQKTLCEISDTLEAALMREGVHYSSIQFRFKQRSIFDRSDSKTDIFVTVANDTQMDLRVVKDGDRLIPMAYNVYCPGT